MFLSLETSRQNRDDDIVFASNTMSDDVKVESKIRTSKNNPRASRQKCFIEP
jgi:hypothetical protein